MRGFAKAEGKAGKVRGGRCWLPRDILEGVPRGRLLRCLVEVEWEFTDFMEALPRPDSLRDWLLCVEPQSRIEGHLFSSSLFR